MSLDIDTLAAAVVAQLNAASTANVFAPSTFTCEFNDTPLFDIEDLVDLKVTILPFRFAPSPSKSMPGQRQPRQFRGMSEYQYVLSLGFQQLGPDGPPATGVDPIRAFSATMRKLVQNVIKFLSNEDNKRPITQAAGQGLWLKTLEVPELYDVMALKNERIFKSFSVLTYEEYVRE